MNQESGKLEAVHLYWALGMIQAMHSIEEVAGHLPDTMHLVSTRLLTIVGLKGFSMSYDAFAMGNLVTVALFLGSVPLLMNDGRKGLFFMAGVAIVECLNGLLHLGGSAVLGHYVPGALTAPFLLVFGGLTLVKVVGQLRQTTQSPKPTSLQAQEQISRP